MTTRSGYPVRSTVRRLTLLATRHLRSPCLQQVVDIGAQLRRVGVPMSIHFPRRTCARPIVNATPFQDRRIRVAEPPAVAVMRGHRSAPAWRLERPDRADCCKRRGGADAEVAREFIGGRGSVDEDV